MFSMYTAIEVFADNVLPSRPLRVDQCFLTNNFVFSQYIETGAIHQS